SGQLHHVRVRQLRRFSRFARLFFCWQSPDRRVFITLECLLDTIFEPNADHFACWVNMHQFTLHFAARWRRPGLIRTAVRLNTAIALEGHKRKYRQNETEGKNRRHLHLHISPSLATAAPRGAPFCSPHPSPRPSRSLVRFLESALLRKP